MRNQLLKSAAIVAGALLIAACGTTQPRTETGPGGAGACDTSKGTLVIGMIAPLSGSLSALGLGMKNSASLAVDQANEKCAVPGYRLAFQPEDDQATAQIGAQAATKLSSDPNVVAVIGTLNSSVAQNAAPVLRTKNILMISPANTNPMLTRGQDYVNNPKREWPNYFRVCTTDAVQGPFAANYAADKAGKKRVAIITDGKTYGDGLAAEFRKQLEKNGGTIVASEKVGEKDTDFSGVIAKIAPSAPEMVYYGGEYPAAGPLSRQMRDAGLNVPLFGGDGIYDPKFIELGGKDGDLATSVGAPTESLPTAKAFIDAYNAKKYAESYSAYGAFSYDAANVIISSLAKAVQGSSWGEDKRAALISNVSSYSGQGATGEIKFDEFGDTTNKILTVYQVTGGKWNAVETGAFQA